MKQQLLYPDLPDGHWKKTGVEASHWVTLADGKIECRLCPRHCHLKDGQFGFNGVRGVVNDKLYTFNYAKSVAATVETIETEAIYHYAPGARILSLGNVGCMMQCDFCQNWETSQVKHLKPSVVQTYEPRQILDMCIDHHIDVVSWTYNDPVVWHEFVVDTSRLLQAHGIRTLYKSAFYIEEAPVDELIGCIDIFSLSLKSMDPEFYRKITKARLEPVLDRIRQVRRSGRHLEVSQLVVTGLNDHPDKLRQTAEWVVKDLGPDVPLHFVAFHPAYRYTSAARTAPEVLYQARDVARSSGVQHCYIGNLYQDGAANTHCGSCGALQVARFGLTTSIVGLTEDNRCRCGAPSAITQPFFGTKEIARPDDFQAVRRTTYQWNREVNTLHVETAGSPGLIHLVSRSLDGGRERVQTLGAGIARVAVSRGSDHETGIELAWDRDAELKLYPILDRAHFPVFEDLETNLQGVRERGRASKAVPVPLPVV